MGLRNAPVERQDSRPFDDFLVEEDVAIEVEIANPDLLGIGKRVNVPLDGLHSRRFAARGRE